MDKRGFTLIELLVTITLMAVISVSVGLSVSNMLSKQKEEDKKYFITSIEKAACTYAGIANSYANVNINTLINNGYISEDMKIPNSNCKIGAIAGQIISVSKSSEGDVICKYNFSMPNECM